MKERVTVAQRPLKGGVTSLFLDYRINGKRRRENLKLYLVPERTTLDRTKNAETIRIAKATRDRKAFELEQMEAGLEVKARPVMLPFRDFAEKYAERFTKTSSRINFQAIVNKVNYFDGKAFVQEMNEEWFKRFIKHLEGLNNRPNTIRKNVKELLAVLKQAKYQNLILNVPKVILPHEEKTIREFLTIDEIRTLQETPCENDAVKQAFLFACFTGLRYSDVVELKPEMIRAGEIVLRQTKTSEPVIITLTDNAIKFMPDGWNKRPFVFKLPGLYTINSVIKSWVRKAKIDKHVSFHVSRHTFATLLFYYGNDLYTVSKLLGHTNVQTTAIYAKLVDDARKKAVNKIPKL